LLHSMAGHLFSDVAVDIIRRLLSAGVDVTIRNNDSYTPVDTIKKVMDNIQKGLVMGFTTQDDYYSRAAASSASVAEVGLFAPAQSTSSSILNLDAFTLG
jgi:hypothetical protein